MANPSENGEVQKLFSARHLGKAPEKSHFAHTCTLLSRFLRDKRIESKDQDPVSSRWTFNLLTTMENPVAPTIDFLPQFLGFGSAAAIDNPSNKLESRILANPEPETAQMTIFYGGKVVVFDDFPAEKAKKIMAMANNEFTSANSETNMATNPTQEHVHNQPKPNASDMPIARRASLHRFLEKRKDRATSSAPYQLNPPPNPPSSSTKALDLNF